MNRPAKLVLLLALAILPVTAASAQAKTYTANCANTYYLEFKPATWSNGCTGSSFNMSIVRWASYGSSSAHATGRVNGAAADLRESRPVTCSHGRAHGKRFFSRVTLKVGGRTHTYSIKAYGGACDYAP